MNLFASFDLLSVELSGILRSVDYSQILQGFAPNLGIMFEIHIAAVSCGSNAPRLGGVKMWLRLMGKLGCAWVMAWHGDVEDVVVVYVK